MDVAANVAVEVGGASPNVYDNAIEVVLDVARTVTVAAERVVSVY